MKKILSLLVPLCLAASMNAMAGAGYVTVDIGLQAGPDDQYPTIADLPAGTPVDIQGCIDGWTWCDAIVGDDRGWIPGNYVQEDYSGQRVYVTDYGPRIGIPIVAFVLGSYWGEYYSHRPWYGERGHWESRHILPHRFARPDGFHVALYHAGGWNHGSSHHGSWHGGDSHHGSVHHHDSHHSDSHHSDAHHGDQHHDDLSHHDSGSHDDRHHAQGAQVHTEHAPAHPAPVHDMAEHHEQPKAEPRKDDHKDDKKHH